MFIRVKVFPDSKEENITEKSKDSFEIKIKEKPERGMANKEILRILSSHLKIPQGKLKMVRGAKSRNKIFKINTDK